MSLLYFYYTCLLGTHKGRNDGVHTLVFLVFTCSRWACLKSARFGPTHTNTTWAHDHYASEEFVEKRWPLQRLFILTIVRDRVSIFFSPYPLWSLVILGSSSSFLISESRVVTNVCQCLWLIGSPLGPHCLSPTDTFSILSGVRSPWSLAESGMFRGPCIVSIFWYISNKMQYYTVYLFLETALHVSGGISTHHQEQIQLYPQHLALVYLSCT